MIAAALGGRGTSGYRGRSAFNELETAMGRLLELGGATCHSRSISVHGRRLHYLESGSGDPVVLLHGAGGGAANWYRLIGPLSEQYRVLVPDLPGFGFSESILPEAPLGRQVASVVRAWLSALGVEHVRAVGTSFGALVALRLAGMLDVRKIVVTDAVGLSREMPWLLRLATLPGIARLAVAPTRRGTRMLLRRVLTTAPMPIEHEAALADYLYWSARGSDVALMARAFTQFAGLIGQRDVLTTDELRALADRLLLVWGEWDAFLPVTSVRRTCALAGCRPVRIIPGAGHSPNWEQPGELLNVIEDFLSE